MPEIRVTKDGPYLVAGDLPIAKATIGANAEGESIRWEWNSPLPAQKNAALCRCGHSSHKPYCDGTHTKIGFDGTETASRKPYREPAKLIEGPVLSLIDAGGLCAFARFCDPNGQLWRLVEETDKTKAREDFRAPCDCPSGGSSPGTTRPASRRAQAAAVDRPSRGPRRGLLGAVMAARRHRRDRRGRPPLRGAERVTLCRCGASKNKPFCDGSHAAIKFKDGL